MDRSPSTSDVSPTSRKWLWFGKKEPHDTHSSQAKMYDVTIVDGVKISIMTSSKQENSYYFQLNKISESIFTISATDVVVPHKFSYELASVGYEGRYYTTSGGRLIEKDEPPENKKYILVYSRGWSSSSLQHQKYPVYVITKPQKMSEKEFIDRYSSVIGLFL